MAAESENVSDASYWEAAYREGRDGWELNAPTPPIVRGLAAIAPGDCALVLGSGRGHEARAAARAGFKRVVGVDFAESAKREAAALTSPELAGRIEWRTQDLFDLPRTDAGAFDLA